MVSTLFTFTFFYNLIFFLTTKTITFFSLIGSIILFSLSSFLAIVSIHFTMRILGGIGTLKDMYKFGLSIWIFPTFINILFFILTLLSQNETLSFILGIFLALIGVYTILVGMVVYSKLQNLSTEYTFMGMFIPFLIMTLIIFLIRLSL